jgi:hypothetical protein
VTPGAADAEEYIPDPPQPTALVEGTITLADPHAEGTRRRELYKMAAGIAKRAGAALVFPTLPLHVVPYGLPVYVAQPRLQHLTAATRAHGMQLVSWPDLPAAVSDDAPDHYRHLMVMPFLW